MKIFTKIMVFSLMSLSVLSTTAQTFAQTAGRSKFIPACVLKDPTGNPADEVVEGEDCRDISIYIILMFKVVNYLFSIVGALALLFFLYGGFTLILSRGSSEQTSKGIEIISAAVIGLIVVFGAYMLVRFLGTSLGLKSEFTLPGS